MPNNQQPFSRQPANRSEDLPAAISDIYDKLEIVLSQLAAANTSIADLQKRVSALESA